MSVMSLTVNRPTDASDHTYFEAEGLLHDARNGDEIAWNALLARYTGLLARITWRQGMNHAERADVAQTTWLRLLTHIDDIRSARGLGCWLATTATRECHAQRRRQQRETPLDVDHLESSPSWEPQNEALDRLDEARRATLLREAVAALPERQRLLIEALLGDDSPSYAQLAERLNMPIGAIGPVRQRALRQLRAHLADRLGDHLLESCN